MLRLLSWLPLTAAVLAVAGCAIRFDIVPREDQVFRDMDDHPESQPVAFERVARWAASESGRFQVSLIDADSVSSTITLSGVHFINRERTPKGVTYRLTTLIQDEFARFEYTVQDFVQPSIKRITRDDMLELQEQYDLVRREILFVIEQGDAGPRHSADDTGTNISLVVTPGMQSCT